MGRNLLLNKILYVLIYLGVLLALIILALEFTEAYSAPEQNNIILVLDTGYIIPEQDNIILVLADVEVNITGCDCPGLNQDWQIDMADNCLIDTDCDLGTGTLSFIGEGFTICDANIKTSDMGNIPNNSILYINDDCLIEKS
jgi:hypothetical protein